MSQRVTWIREDRVEFLTGGMPVPVKEALDSIRANCRPGGK